MGGRGLLAKDKYEGDRARQKESSSHRNARIWAAKQHGSEMHWTYRIRSAFPAGSVLGNIGILLQLQGVQPLLALVGHGLDLIDRLRHVKSGGWWWWGNAILPVFGLLFNHVPPVRTRLFALVCIVLVLCVIVRAFIEELRVDLHEHLHRIVNHAVDCSG